MLLLLRWNWNPGSLVYIWRGDERSLRWSIDLRSRRHGISSTTREMAPINASLVYHSIGPRCLRVMIRVLRRRWLGLRGCGPGNRNGTGLRLLVVTLLPRRTSLAVVALGLARTIRSLLAGDTLRPIRSLGSGWAVICRLPLVRLRHPTLWVVLLVWGVLVMVLLGRRGTTWRLIVCSWVIGLGIGIQPILIHTHYRGRLLDDRASKGALRCKLNISRSNDPLRVLDTHCCSINISL
mmetsp:Transcript_20021/g.27720  ORF Transcript_20021/g.27720 Transcript_20021/m.27720 type:complete len:237 (-) Transcript_20021:149-859(-)